MEYLDRIEMVMAEIYMCRPPEGLLVPTTVTPTDVDDVVPEEEGIVQAMRGLKSGRAGGRYGMLT